MITGSTYRFHMAFSNIDRNASDGARGPTELQIELRWEP
jgi:hypothetical protein